jgi:Rieske Fe-S protein
MMRRRELLAAWRPLAAALAGLGLLPSAVYWWRSTRSGDSSSSDWADAGPTAGLLEDVWQPRSLEIERRNRWRVDRERHTVYARRRGTGFEVVSSVCPHTGCLVQRDGAGFACPCHWSHFDGEGRPLDGPAPRPLDRLEWRLEAGRLRVRLVNFRPGAARSEPLRP